MFPINAQNTKLRKKWELHEVFGKLKGEILNNVGKHRTSQAFQMDILKVSSSCFTRILCYRQQIALFKREGTQIMNIISLVKYFMV